MKCPRCKHKALSQGALHVVKDEPGLKTTIRRYRCTNGKCGLHFKAEVNVHAYTQQEATSAVTNDSS